MRVFQKITGLLVIILLGSISSLAQKTLSSEQRRAMIMDTTKNPVRTTTPKTTTQTPAKQGKGSQIVNDSTKNIYGPKTTQWISANDVFYNRKDYKLLDTTLTDYHRWTYIQRLNNFYHDLGNIGTALNSIYPIVSSTIGASSGYSVYQLYYDTEEPIYYNTKSPYTTFRLVWGGDGRAMSRVEFSRNINPRWNFGFNFRPILVDKQVQRKGKGDRQTLSYYYDLYTSYKSKNDRYTLLANLRRFRHRVNENGGIMLVRDTTENGYYDPNAQPYLVKAQTEEKRVDIHLFHHYQLAKPFQVYHKADITSQLNVFRNDSASEVNYKKYFSFTNSDSDIKTDTVEDAQTFKTIVNEVGIKGNAAFLFYNFYFKLRNFSTFNRYVYEEQLSFKNDGSEKYVGGRIAFRFDSLSELSGRAEYLLDGNYLLEAQIKTPWLDARGVSALAKPGFKSLAYRGSHNAWVNNFSNTFTNQLEAFLKARWGGFFISPGARYTILNNYIYYKENKVAGEQTVLPVQSSGNQQIFSPEVRMQLRFFRHMYLRPQVVYTSFLKNDDDAIRAPEWFANVQLAYENWLFNKNILVQMGVDTHWRSSYTAMGYDPAIQQYYVQNSFTNQSFPLVDVFFNGGFKRGRFFAKYHNLIQLFTDKGYLPTPGYRGQVNILDFGFDLILFD